MVCRLWPGSASVCVSSSLSVSLSHSCRISQDPVHPFSIHVSVRPERNSPRWSGGTPDPPSPLRVDFSPFFVVVNGTEKSKKVDTDAVAAVA